MELLPKLHSLVSDTLQDVFSMHEGLHKASLYVLSDDELTEFVRYSDSYSITVVRSDNRDITTASPWKVLNDVATINTTLCLSECQSVVDPYIQSNNINSFVCAPVCKLENIQLFLWSDSTVKTVVFSDYDEQQISRWAEDFQSTINELSESENTSVVDAVSVLVDNKGSVSALPAGQNTGDSGVKALAESAVRIEGLEAVETHLRIYERAVKATNSGVTITDARLQDYPIIYCNPAFEKMTGYSFAETVGRNARFLQGDENEQSALQTIREALDKGTHCKVTLRNYKKDGALFWNELTLSPIIDSDGFLTHYIGIQNDITARVDAERNLLDAKERELKVPKLLAQAASLANVVGWQFDLNSGQMLVVGNVYGLIHQRDENIMTPSHLFDCVLPSHVESAVDIELNRVLPVCVESGQEKRIHYIAKLFPTGVSRDGGPCLAGTLQDVTDFTSTFVK